MKFIFFLLFIITLILLLDVNRSRIFFMAIKKYGIKKGYKLFEKFDDSEEFMPDSLRENLRQEILKDITALERNL